MTICHPSPTALFRTTTHKSLATAHRPTSQSLATAHRPMSKQSILPDMLATRRSAETKYGRRALCRFRVFLWFQKGTTMSLSALRCRAKGPLNGHALGVAEEAAAPCIGNGRGYNSRLGVDEHAPWEATLKPHGIVGKASRVCCGKRPEAGRRDLAVGSVADASKKVSSAASSVISQPRAIAQQSLRESSAVRMEC